MLIPILKVVNSLVIVMALYVLEQSIVYRREWVNVLIDFIFLCIFVAGMYWHPANVERAIPYMALMVSLTLVLFQEAAVSREWRISSITAASVKECIDQAPKAICFFLDSGQIKIRNPKMEELYTRMTGDKLRNGNDLLKLLETIRIGDTYIAELSDQEVYRFEKEVLDIEGIPVFEVVSTDITTEYKLTRRLQREQERLTEINARLKAYGEHVTEVTREKEILDAKVRIHDKMNQVILASRRSIDNKDERQRREIIELWKENIVYLCRDDDVEKHDVHKMLQDAADFIGIRLHMDGSLQGLKKSTARVFTLAVSEAMTNAVKYADATSTFVTVRSDIYHDTIIIENDGKAPSGKIREGGGLSSLRRQVESCNGTMEVSGDEKFRLTISIPV